MLSLLPLGLVGLIPVAAGAAVHGIRQVESTSPSIGSSCPITVASYVTVTVTDVPPTVTIVVPDYSSIAASISSASVIDSIVVVEQSQNRPISAPINTAIPTFVHTIVAPAFEATEASTSNNTSVYYVSASRNGSTHAATSLPGVVVGVTTVSILPHSVNNSQPDLTTTIRSTLRVTSTVRGPFSTAAAGWNSTNTNSTAVDALGATGSSARPLNMSTVTTYVATQTVIAATTITASPASPAYNSGGYGYLQPPQQSGTSQADVEKRQTCVLVSAAFAGVWGTWCNNWDGHTTMSYTSWETTVTPGITHGASSTVATSAIPSTSIAQPSNQSPSAVPNLPTTPGCGEIGPFSIDFDTLPAQSASDENAGLPPIFNPYDHFYWSESWSYVPPPPAPYAPQSGKQLGVSTPLNQSIPTVSLSGIEIPDGGFGAGPRSQTNAYWFNAHWAFVGCQANIANPSETGTATGTCDFIAQGYRFDTTTGRSRVHVTQHFNQPLCESASQGQGQGQCQLQRIEFNPMFNALTTLSFYAKVGDQFRPLYVDTMGLGWWNNTCEAGTVRSSSRK